MTQATVKWPLTSLGRVPWPALRTFGERAAPWLTFGPIVAVRMIFLVTYSLNNMGGDTSSYFHMLVSGKSSLVHAGGYPFLMGLPFRHGPLAGLADGSPEIFEAILLTAQHGISLMALAVMFRFVRRLYGSLAASISVLGLGLSARLMGATSSVYPEWLQAVLLILAGCTAGHAFLHGGRFGKVAWYAVSATIFAWCFLVKFNAAVLAILYPIAGFAEKAPVARKLSVGAMLTAIAVCNLGVYELLFHYPTTGTYALTYDTAWVLLSNTQRTFENQLSPANGLATKRWLALATVLPMRYDVAGPEMFSHVDAIPREVRAPYRPIFAKFAAANAAFLEDWLRSHPIPEGFTVGVSMIPVGYFVGLREGNELGIAVALEAIGADPWTFGKRVLTKLKTAMTRPQTDALFPLPANMLRFGFSPEGPSLRGFVGLQQYSRLSDVPYGYRRPVVWRPGLQFFSLVSRWAEPPRVLAFLMFFAVAVAALKSTVERQVDLAAGVTLTLAVCLTVYVVTSCLTLDFRVKEQCLAMPIISTLVGVGLTWAPREALKLVRRLVAS